MLDDFIRTSTHHWLISLGIKSTPESCVLQVFFPDHFADLCHSQVVPGQCHFISNNDTSLRAGPRLRTNLGFGVKYGHASRGRERCAIRHPDRRRQPGEPEARCKDPREVRSPGRDRGERSTCGGRVQGSCAEEPAVRRHSCGSRLPFYSLLVRSSELIASRSADGRFYAIYGWYGGHGAHPYVRTDPWPGANPHHRVNRARKYVLCSFCLGRRKAQLASPVIGDRERCLQAGMDDHITSTYCVRCSPGPQTHALHRTATPQRSHELNQQACGREEDGIGTESCPTSFLVPHAGSVARVPVNLTTFAISSAYPSLAAPILVPHYALCAFIVSLCMYYHHLLLCVPRTFSSVSPSRSRLVLSAARFRLLASLYCSSLSSPFTNYICYLPFIVHKHVFHCKEFSSLEKSTYKIVIAT